MKAVPRLHVGLDVEQILEPDPPRLPWRSFKHEAAKLGVEDGRSGGILPGLINQGGSAKGTRTGSLYGTSLHVWHAAAVFEQLLVLG